MKSRILALCLFVTGMAASQHVDAQLKAGFTANNLAGCSPLVVQFKDTSTGMPTAWKWDLGNGTISVFQNPSTVYFTPGTYAVKLVAKNVNGADSIVKQQYITVYDNPVVDFKASDSTGCFPAHISFTDKSSVSGATINRWKWDFGNGDTSNLPNPKHTYDAAGNYTVTLSVSSDKGCGKSFSKVQYIKIASGVKAAFDYSAATATCSAPVTVNFQNNSIEAGNVSYQWNFGDGQISTDKAPQHTYTSNGTYTVTLIAVNAAGCTDTLRKTNLLAIGNAQTLFTAPESVCANKLFTLTNNSNPVPASVQWTFGDSTGSTAANPKKLYAAAGVYTIKLINRFAACTDSLTKAIKVLAQPVANFRVNKGYACSVPAAIQFSNTASDAVAYEWQFGDGGVSTLANPLHTYTAYGNYDVRLVVTNSNGCTDTIVQKSVVRVVRPQITLKNLPVRGCLPFKVPFTAAVNVEDNITGYRWDFGDGSTSISVNPEHTYTKEGKFTVKLVITTATGCMDSVIMPEAVQTSRVPVADFIAWPTEVCGTQPVNFVNKSEPVGDGWSWTFNDGGFASGANPRHQFGDTGYFKITLIVSNNGCSDTVTKSKVVHVNPPFARFSVDMNCGDKYTRRFTNNSIAPQSWFWEFGDGTTSTDFSPKHVYAAKGSYKVKLTVKNGSCQETNTQQIIIADEHPDFKAEVTEACKGQEVAFTPSGIDATYISKLVWDFGDGTAQTIAGNIKHVFAKAGQYDVMLIATDVNNCVDTVLKKQIVRVYGPKANFDRQQPAICIDGTAVFNDQSLTDGIHPIIARTFSFGDGQRLNFTAAPYTHDYKTGGVYDVTLLVTDNFGCTDSIVKFAIVRVSDPNAAFETPNTNSCPGKPVQFNNGSTGNGLQYRWSFGDNQFSTNASPAHQYQMPGRYTVKLWVNDPIGCRDSMERVQYVSITVPKAAFKVSDSIGTCPPLQVQFTNKAAGYNNLKWDFGDGAISSLENPFHNYTLPGVYFAKQIVEVSGGCTDTLVQKIIVKGPSGAFTYNPNVGCIPMTVQFKATGNSIASVIWDFNDGSIAAQKDKSIEYKYELAGSFVPRLVLIDSAGCHVTITGADTINAIGVVAKATINEYRVCNEGDVQFTDQSVANDFIASHHWDFGDGSSSTAAQPKHRFAAAPAGYTVTHTVTTAHGCKAAVTFADSIKVYAVPVIAITGDQAACEPAQLGFQSSVSGDATNVKLTWDFGNGKSAGSANTIKQSFNTAGTYQVALQMVYKDFCRDTAYRTINIWPLPKTALGADTYVCRDQPKPLQASGADRYKWQAAADLSCSDCAVTMINPASDASYVVTGITSHGCERNDTINVRVRQRFTMQVMPGDTLCAGQSMKLTATGAEQYQWYPAIGLDATSGAAPKASPTHTTTYTVVGTDNDHCFTDTGVAHVVVYPVPQIFAGNDTTVTTGSTIQLHTKSSADITKWNWSPATGLNCTTCPNPQAAIKTNIRYKLRVSNEGGCSAEDNIDIVAVCNDANYFIPNTFSPNNDGANDVFYVQGKGLNRIQSMRIFNRWGQAVYEKRDFMPNDPSAGWDGTFNGQPANMDVYVYIVEVICDNSAIVPYKGNVALIR